MKKPLILIIMDGFGINAKTITATRFMPPDTPNLDKVVCRDGPTTQIGASGMDVGLPDGQMGNSRRSVTPISVRARIVYQELTRITKIDCRTATFLKMRRFQTPLKTARKTAPPCT